MSDEVKAPRWDSLHELLARAQALGLNVSVNIHGVPSEELLDWLRLGLLDAIEQGAPGNPLTGELEAGSHRGAGGRTAATCFMEDDQERKRRIARQEQELLDSLVEPEEVA